MNLENKTLGELLELCPERYKNIKFDVEVARKDYKEIESRGGIYYCGNVGVGKTVRLYNTYALYTQLQSEGQKYFNKFFGGVINPANLFMKIKSNLDEYNQIVYKYQKESEILFLDDFGVEVGTPFEMQILFQIIDFRWQYKKKIVMTSNYTPSEWISKSDTSLQSVRIVERLSDMCKIEKISGSSKRN